VTGSNERLRGVSESPVGHAHRRLSRSLLDNIGVAAIYLSSFFVFLLYPIFVLTPPTSSFFLLHFSYSFTTANDPPAPAAPLSKLCANCRGENAPQRCSVCKKVCYCNATCAKQDWQFHKRICSKPVTPAPNPAPASAPSSSSSSSSTSSTSSTNKSVDTKKPTSSTSSEDIEYDEDEKAAIEEIKRKGYRHFTSQADAGGLKGVAGGLAPKAISSSDAVSPTASSYQVSSTSSSSSASEWNKSGTTYEARSLGDFCKSRLKELLAAMRAKEAVPLPGIGTLVASGVTNWGESMADIVITRGKVKHIYDLSFKVSVHIVPEAESSSTSSLSSSSDGGDDDDEPPKSKEKGSAATASSTNSASSSTSSDESSASPKPPKRPRVLVSFMDVSNTSEGESSESTFRDVKIEWGSPSPQEAHKSAIKAALDVERKDGGLVFALRRAVETVVDEFKKK